MGRLISLITILIGVGLVTMIVVSIKRLNRRMHRCIIGCGGGVICRKVTYDWNGSNKRENMRYPCIINVWNVSHIILYAVLSYMFEEYRLLLFVIGIVWEMLEGIIGHNNNLDILWNGVGIMIGVMIK